MRIVESAVNLASTRLSSTSDLTRATTEVWVGQRRPNGAITTVTPGLSGLDAGAVAARTPIASAVRIANPAALSSISDQARRALQTLAGQIMAPSMSAADAAAAADDESDPLAGDPKLRLLAYLVEAMTGRKVRVIDAKALRTDAEAAARQAGRATAAAQSASRAQGSSEGAQPVGWGVDIQVEQIHQETETTGYQATGRIVTADGQTVSVDFELVMHRDQTQVVRTEIQAGDAVRAVDPIAIKVGAGPVGLSDARTGFDIDSDGTAENVALPAAGTYFLALDRDGNGKIDNGGELFGPTSGNGFAEVRRLDGDGNGWIDEGDAAYATLRLWARSDDSTMSLAEAGVGALYVGSSAATQFDLRSSAGEELGQIRTSSVYLTQDGRPGAMMQVDLTA